MDVKDIAEQSYKNGYENGKKEIARELINEFATILITLRVGKVLNKKLQDPPISKGGYLFVFENLKQLAEKYNIKIGETK